MELIIVLLLGAVLSLVLGHLVQRRVERRRTAVNHGQKDFQG